MEALKDLQRRHLKCSNSDILLNEPYLVSDAAFCCPSNTEVNLDSAPL